MKCIKHELRNTCQNGSSHTEKWKTIAHPIYEREEKKTCWKSDLKIRRDIVKHTPKHFQNHNTLQYMEIASFFNQHKIEYKQQR